MRRSYELRSKLLKGGYIGEYIFDYYRGVTKQDIIDNGTYLFGDDSPGYWQTCLAF